MTRPRPRTGAHLLICAALLGANLPGPAWGQWRPRPEEPPLTKDDLARLHGVVMQLNESGAAGQSATWRSPGSRDAGEVTITRVFQARGMACRKLGYAIRFGSRPDQVERFSHAWCRFPSGDWKIVEKSR